MLNPFKSKPTERFIKCCIATPQFHGDSTNFHLHKQSGTFDTYTLKFTSDKENQEDHDVNFHDINDFYKYKIKC